jgi:phosphomannomutase
VQCKTGHAFIKERMRVEDAAYGGEMSAHHYFRDFSYCDSGMIPWLLVVGLMSVTGMRLSDLVDRAMRAYPVSGEINLALNPGAEVGGVLEAVRGHYADGVLWEDRTDGLGMEFKDWRFNLRTSNTEPVVRLNVEARTDRALMEKATGELLELLRQLGGEGAA